MIDRRDISLKNTNKKSKYAARYFWVFGFVDLKTKIAKNVDRKAI